MTINTTLIEFIVGVIELSAQKPVFWWIICVCVVGILLCISWFAPLNAYSNLKSARFKIIHEIETKLPAKALSCLRMGHYEPALDYYRYAQQLCDRQGICNQLCNIGLVFSSLGGYEEALEIYSQALILRRELSDLDGELTNLVNLGRSHHYLGNLEKALENQKTALKLAYQQEAKGVCASILCSLGNTYTDMKATEKAYPSYLRAAELSEEVVINMQWLLPLGI